MISLELAKSLLVLVCSFLCRFVITQNANEYGLLLYSALLYFIEIKIYHCEITCTFLSPRGNPEDYPCFLLRCEPALEGGELGRMVRL
jgi:hypothetical protein